MRKYDYHWKDNDDWYQYNERGFFEVRSDAPEEAKESYRRYLSQKERASKDMSEHGYLD